MQNKFILLCAATVALAACAKTEVTPEIPNQDSEITFLTAPVTKAETIKFGEDNVFKSAAFYHVASFTYGVEAEEFISPVQISCTDKTNKIWKAASTYYWPKDGGKLTFFSWTLNTNSLKYNDKTDPAVTIDVTNGVKLTGYSSAKNDDFMVAEIAKDQTKNQSPASYTTVSGVADGVPTLFKHKTAKVSILAKTKDDYTGKPYYQKFEITDISFVNVATKGDYTQATEEWTNTTSGTLTYFTGENEVVYNGGVAQDVTSTGTELYIPETFTDDTQELQVKYTVTKTDGQFVNQKADHIATISMKDLLGSIEAGKKYTITLTFALDEIKWDPAVSDWVDGTAGSTEIK